MPIVNTDPTTDDRYTPEFRAEMKRAQDSLDADEFMRTVEPAPARTADAEEREAAALIDRLDAEEARAR